MKLITRILTAITSGLLSAQLVAAPIFVEDFESNLSGWTGKNFGSHQGVIVVDPLNSGNNVLTFSGLNSAGDIFSLDTITSTSGTFTVQFDYLGMPGLGGVPGDLGGFFGVSKDFPGNHYWVAGTGSYATPIGLIDDGAWHTYNLTFSTPAAVGNVVRFMLEDYVSSGGVAGDVFFDNITFGDSDVVAQSVSEPGVFFLLLGGVLSLLMFRRRIKR